MQPQKSEFRQSRVINASPVYYGWIILFAGSFGIMATMPGQTVSISVFLDRMIGSHPGYIAGIVHQSFRTSLVKQP